MTQFTPTPSSDEQGYSIYQIGGLFVPGKTTWEEQSQFTYAAGHALVTLVWPRLTAAEVMAVDHGPLHYALYAEDEQIVFFLKLGAASGWLELPYTYWRVDPEERALPALPTLSRDAEDADEGTAPRATPGDPGTPGTSGTHQLVQTFLVQAETGRIAAMRLCTVSAAFTQALFAAIHRQASIQFDASAYDAGLEALRQRYPSPDAFVADTDVVRVRCAGGE